ncbi:hypothetical protein LCGC14_0593640 [marine sediment metagenome]|uniref:Uncharacterized protein n=1 Tax=marine sediment metagenome TaxID=412755 RepID=A0A0F9RHN6_9ZZZZ
MKTYTKNTGITSHLEVKADFFKVAKVTLEVHYAPTKKDLADGKNIHSRSYDLPLPADIEQQLLKLAIHKGAKIV